MELDKQQSAAVNPQSKKALVLAGAGSGKTRVLTERIAHLMGNCKVSPFEVVAITFTRKAAGEMKERRTNRIHGAHKLTVGTMHSVALRMIQQFGEAIGLKPKQTTVYSEWESSYLLREVAIDLGIYNGKSWKILVTVERGIDSAGLVNLIRAINDRKDQCTFLSRNHVLLQKLSTLLAEAGITHNFGQKMAITNSEGFRRFHAFLKLIVNYYDNFSFLLIRDILALDRRAYNKIRLRAITKSRSHFQAWIYQTVSDWGDFFDCAAEGWSFAGTLLHLQDMVKLEEAFYPAIAFIGQWIEPNPTGTIDQYLSWLATYDISEEVETGDDADIQLMTIHAAKGLEWENVIIAGCNEGLIPSKKAIAAGNLEDERRLMYVAITRARGNLMVTVRPEQSEGKNGHIYKNPISRFVMESLAQN
jgi:hypothetical protein